MLIPGQGAQQGCVSLLQVQHHGVLVRAFDAGNVRIQGAGNEAALRHDLLIGELHVLRGEVHAVVPLHAGRQMEGVGQAILGNVPGAGQAGNHLGVVVQLQQAVKHVLIDIMTVVIALQHGVEGHRVATQADDEGLLVLSAGSDSKAAERQHHGQENAEKPFHKLHPSSLCLQVWEIYCAVSKPQEA